MRGICITCTKSYETNLLYIYLLCGLWQHHKLLRSRHLHVARLGVSKVCGPQMQTPMLLGWAVLFLIAPSQVCGSSNAEAHDIGETKEKLPCFVSFKFLPHLPSVHFCICSLSSCRFKSAFLLSSLKENGLALMRNTIWYNLQCACEEWVSYLWGKMNNKESYQFIYHLMIFLVFYLIVGTIFW